MPTPADRPTSAELVVAVHEFLETEILPTIDAQRVRFRMLVAMNALSIVARETAELPQTADWTMAHRIRSGDVRPGDLADLKRDVETKLRTSSPRYLERYT